MSMATPTWHFAFPRRGSDRLTLESPLTLAGRAVVQPSFTAASQYWSIQLFALQVLPARWFQMQIVQPPQWCEPGDCKYHYWQH
jgi:hypothetical protein